MDDTKIAALTKATREAMAGELVPVNRGITELANLTQKAFERIKALEARGAPSGLTKEALDQWGGDLYAAVDTFVQKRSAPLLDRIERLEAELAKTRRIMNPGGR